MKRLILLVLSLTIAISSLCSASEINLGITSSIYGLDSAWIEGFAFAIGPSISWGTGDLRIGFFGGIDPLANERLAIIQGDYANAIDGMIYQMAAWGEWPSDGTLFASGTLSSLVLDFDGAQGWTIYQATIGAGVRFPPFWGRSELGFGWFQFGSHSEASLGGLTLAIGMDFSLSASTPQEEMLSALPSPGAQPLPIRDEQVPISESTQDTKTEDQPIVFPHLPPFLEEPEPDTGTLNAFAVDEMVGVGSDLITLIRFKSYADIVGGTVSGFYDMRVVYEDRLGSNPVVELVSSSSVKTTVSMRFNHLHGDRNSYLALRVRSLALLGPISLDFCVVDAKDATSNTVAIRSEVVSKSKLYSGLNTVLVLLGLGLLLWLAQK